MGRESMEKCIIYSQLRDLTIFFFCSRPTFFQKTDKPFNSCRNKETTKKKNKFLPQNLGQNLYCINKVIFIFDKYSYYSEMVSFLRQNLHIEMELPKCYF
jgi:hypothetical protein